MAKAFAKPFYNSQQWKDCRQSYISYRVATDGGLCEKCQQRLGFIVHHKIKLTEQNINDSSITLSFDNLSYECKDCHDREEEHFIKNNHEVKVLFDASGNPIDIRKIDDQTDSPSQQGAFGF